MVQIIKIDFHFIGPDDLIIVSFRIGLLGKQLFLVAVLDAGWPCDAWAELQDASVVALQLVGIAGHIGSWAYKTHLPNEDIDQLGETVHFAVTQPMAHACDARVVGRSDRVAFRLMEHGAKLTDPERFSVFTYAFLHEKCRTFRIDLDEYGNDKQRQKQHDKTHQCHDTVEAPLEEEPYLVFIFLHAAWPPC